MSEIKPNYYPHCENCKEVFMLEDIRARSEWYCPFCGTKQTFEPIGTREPWSDMWESPRVAAKLKAQLAAHNTSPDKEIDTPPTAPEGER